MLINEFDESTNSLTNESVEKVERIFHEFTVCSYPRQKMFNISLACYFLQFDKCDVISHLHTVTGQYFNRLITVAP